MVLKIVGDNDDDDDERDKHGRATKQRLSAPHQSICPKITHSMLRDYMRS